MAKLWVEALLALHDGGWEADDIDSACEALAEACEGGLYRDSEILELESADVVKILENEFDEDEAASLVILADVYSRQNSQSAALRRSLTDLDAFAYSYSYDEEE